MHRQANPRTAATNGPLWGARVRDWGEVQERMLAPVFRRVLERLQVGPGQRLLDIGCGAGMAARLAHAGGAEVCGLDASEAMLDFARSRAPEVRFQPGDMEALPYADDSFDLVTAFNAVQYAGNPALALAEMRRVLRPGGRLGIVTWGDTEHMQAASFNACLRPLMPPPPPDAPHPFNLSTAEALEEFVREAGFAPLEGAEIEAPWTYPDRATALRGVLSAGVVVRAMQILGEEVVERAYGAALERFRLPDASYRIGAAFRYLLAEA